MHREWLIGKYAKQDPNQQQYLDSEAGVDSLWSASQILWVLISFQILWTLALKEKW